MRRWRLRHWRREAAHGGGRRRCGRRESVTARATSGSDHQRGPGGGGGGDTVEGEDVATRSSSFATQLPPTTPAHGCFLLAPFPL
ncbi:hypothetical protein [Oryza sativa Japonica Group]|uniref:Uncharacterized protein n=1 Tax=Oryza sativa subsp. japonica TaxID=39947 RepID=Q5N9G3_ORYSJ|nr:hypothetical protein [Oryza sativa Japonica Group]BAD81890.1 hypothetical protein [Oryza sativa Japonica Group]